MPTLEECLPKLTEIWLDAYRAAVTEGFSHRPSGPFVDDRHCATMAAICGSGDGYVPAAYGGTMPDGKLPTRWSATRRAALPTFETGLRLGLNIKNAARGVNAAKRHARRSLSIPTECKIPLEVWLAASQDRRTACLEFFQTKQRWRAAWQGAFWSIGPKCRLFADGNWRTSKILEEPLSAEDQNFYLSSGPSRLRSC